MDFIANSVVDILRKRAEKALIKSSFTNELLEKNAERTDGNMMLAINLLRTAALKAENEGRETIVVSDLPETIRITDNPEKLSIDEVLLLDILKEKKRLRSHELFTVYRKLASHPKGERSFRKYMETLCSKGFIRAVGMNRWRTYEIVYDIQ